MATQRMTMAQALVKFLNAQYVSLDGVEQPFVDGVFTIFGHGIVCGLGQALDEDPGSLRVYQGRNEQGMAHVATAFARQLNRRKIIACASSIGPGAANMVTAVASATVNNIPLLVFTGDAFATRQPDPVLQQLEQFHDQSITTSDAFRPVSRYWDRVSRPEQLMTAMLNAMRVLTDGAVTGGVCISLPQDVQGEAWDYPDYFFQKRVHIIARPQPDSTELARAAERIAAAKKPLVVCGGGVRYSEAGAELLAFCRAFGIPFGETQAGKSAMPSSDPLNLGGVGVTGNSAANAIAREADLVIGVGTRFSDFTTGSKELFSNPDVEFVTVNLSRFHAQKMDATPVVADALVAVRALRGELAERGYRAAYSGEIEAARAAWAQEMRRLGGITYGAEDFRPLVEEMEPGLLEEFVQATGGVITQTQALAIIREEIEQDAIVIGASGSLPGDLQRMWTTDAKDAYHMEYGYSCMGYEIAGALGCKLARPDTAVYSMVGDGSFMMLHSEMTTAIQEDKKIVILLFDNCGFGCINNLQMGQGIGSLATTFRHRSGSGRQDGRLITTDFAQIAQGYGYAAYTAKTHEELRQALRAAKGEEGCVLIDIKVLPKTMTGGYDSWWHVGLARATQKASVRAACEEKDRRLAGARKY